jgi:Ca-activated chloride channel homolog
VTWGHADVLLGLWGIPVLALLLVLFVRRRTALVRKLGVLVAPEDAARIATAHTARAALQVVGVTCVVLAIAMPRWGFRWQELHRSGLELVIVLDVSHSMDAQDVSPSRLERAKRKIVDLSGMLTGDKVGLVQFAGGAFPRMPLTLDYSALRDLTADTTTSTLTAPGSDIGSAIEVATELLSDRGQADRAIVLLSDGEDLAGNARAAADKAAAAGIHLYAIGFGTAEGAPVPQEGGGFKKDASGERVISRLDDDLLKDVAARGSGAYVQSTAGPADVQGIFEDEIKGKLQSADTGVRREKVWDERFQWPLAVGLLCFLLAEIAEWFVREPRRRSASVVVAALALLFPATVRADLPPDVQALLAEQVEHPNDLDLAERVGEALYRAGEYDRARRVLDEVAERSQSKEQQVRAKYNAALSAYKNGHLVEAIDGWKSVLGEEKGHASSTQNLDAAQKELQARLQEQPPPEQQQQEQEQQEQQEQEQQEQQEQQQQQQEQQQQEQGEPQQQSGQEQQGQSEQEPEGTTGERGEIEPADGAAETVEGSGSGSGQPLTEQELSEAEAKHFLDSLEEGTPRVPLRGRDNAGKDW